MPRLHMIIQNNNIPRGFPHPLASYNARINKGPAPVAPQNLSSRTMAFKSSMVGRIAGLKPGCGACGK